MSDGYVVIGRDPEQVPHDPNIAFGPFATEEEADEMRDLCDATTSGRYVTLPLRTPTGPRQ